MAGSTASTSLTDTDRILIAQAREIGRELRGECTDRDRLAGWLLKELAERLEFVLADDVGPAAGAVRSYVAWKTGA